MDRYLSLDEIIDKNAYDFTIHKMFSQMTPDFMEAYERFVKAVTLNTACIHWMEMKKELFTATVYVFADPKQLKEFSTKYKIKEQEKHIYYADENFKF